jgi:hypothetical protein
MAKKNPLEILKSKVSPKSTAGLLRDRKKSLDEKIAEAEGGTKKKKQ